jgi:hypothetical protein
MMKPVIDVVRESMHVWTNMAMAPKIHSGDPHDTGERFMAEVPTRAEIDEAAQHIIEALDAAGYRIVPK